MIKWEYCIVSGVETSVMRKFALSLSFSSGEQENQNLEIELDRNRGEEVFTARLLGELGDQGWEVIAFGRSAAKFEAVLKRPGRLDFTGKSIGFELSNGLGS